MCNCHNLTFLLGEDKKTTIGLSNPLSLFFATFILSSFFFPFCFPCSIITFYLPLLALLQVVARFEFFLFFLSSFLFNLILMFLEVKSFFCLLLYFFKSRCRLKNWKKRQTTFFFRFFFFHIYIYNFFLLSILLLLFLLFFIIIYIYVLLYFLFLFHLVYNFIRFYVFFLFSFFSGLRNI